MASASEEKVILYTVLQCENKPMHVFLTSTGIIIENSSRPRSHDASLDARPSFSPANVVIPLREVIAVRAELTGVAKENTSSLLKSETSHRQHFPQRERAKGTNSFAVYMVKRVSRHRWRHKCKQFVCIDYGTCQIWVSKIQELLSNPEWKRPKRLLVFVNPFGGKRRGPKIFDQKVRPLFQLAGIYSEVIVTKRQFHARDIIYDYDLETVDGLVCVGGDGTFSELLNGLLDRSCSNADLEQTFRHKPTRPPLRIGIIPAGSTDAVVYSTVGINDPVTSALQIVLGDCVGIDVAAVYKKEEFLKYTTTMSGYGYYGDLLKDSENLRWMGPKRYTWSGLKTFVSNKSYQGEVSFLLASDQDSGPRDQSICYSGCDKCRLAGVRQAETTTRESVREVDLGSAVSNHGNPSSLTAKDGWHRVKGHFSAINLVTMPCRCDLSPTGMSPSSHLGDGCMDLILISDCSRLQYLRHLVRIPDSKADQFDLDYVQVYRVKEFRFQPALEPEDQDEGEGEQRGGCRRKSGHQQLGSRSQPKENSVWNCDGEVLDFPALHFQIHCQLIQLFGRGVEEMNKEEAFHCPPCCSSYDSDR